MSRKVIGYIGIIAIAFSTLLLLTINHYAKSSFDVVSQTGQWLALCSYGAVALITIGVMIIACRGVAKSFACVAAWCIAAIGVAEAVLAMMQLYGFEYSNHGLYKQTGTFYNPGPLGGYIAVCIPAAIWLWRTSAYKWAGNIALGALMVMLVVEPSTMSRGGWIAAAIGALYVAFYTTDVRRRIESLGRKRAIIAGGCATIVTAVALVGAWHIKRDSAFGRLFLWKMSCKAIAASPITGHDSFAEAYGDAQETYYADGGTDWEKLVAGSPEYAFNEYLNYTILWGIPAMVAVLALITTAFVAGHRKRRYGLCGSLISLCVFAFSSYPMHLPAFVAMLAVIIIACLARESKMRHAVGVMTICMGIMLMMQRTTYASRLESTSKWNKAKYLYESKRYKMAASQYESIKDGMDWNGRFMYEYRHSLHYIACQRGHIRIICCFCYIPTQRIMMRRRRLQRLTYC